MQIDIYSINYLYLLKLSSWQYSNLRKYINTCVIYVAVFWPLINNLLMKSNSIIWLNTIIENISQIYAEY